MEGAERITELATRLVQRTLQPGADAGTVTKLTSYVVRILGSRIAPSISGDEQHLSQVIQKKLVRGQSVAVAAKFADLHRRLAQSSVLQQRWSIIYLLHMLSEPGSEHTGSSAPILETAFHSLGLEQLDHQAPHAIEAVRNVGSAAVAESSVVGEPKSRTTRVAEQVLELHSACHEAVSYTHLTLPTKRIV
eukprot:TRINITY_DN28744_c0_g1_i2.p1 TRINITY_DN28744_c0_g1~~TRINITY_DN28744_c0_g1_i2.p1  ORF type:complete len:191 (+),score=31.01 TRINITY_DN28744_c0_g1_i2:131-703(+)